MSRGQSTQTFNTARHRMRLTLATRRMPLEPRRTTSAIIRTNWRSLYVEILIPRAASMTRRSIPG